MKKPHDSPLGKSTAYPDRYDPSLLFSIDRREAREGLGLSGSLPFSGVDIWTAHELAWLDHDGRPQVAIGEFRIDARSASLVESKSLKLYLGSFAQQRVGTAEELSAIVAADLSRSCAVAVDVALLRLDEARQVAELPAESIDALDATIDHYLPDASLLKIGKERVEEALRTSLFRSNCPVTGQPDYADLMVRYRGRRIDRSSMLSYLVSYRQHAAFHEACVERIFIDIAARCRPEGLTVYARFLRRGGIDINPFRSNFEAAPRSSARTPRQ